MLIKHKNGQSVDYSLIARMPPYRSVKAFKSSDFHTEYSGNMPAELVIKVTENKYIRTTNFVAEYDDDLSSFEILDKSVHNSLVEMICDSTLTTQNPKPIIDEVINVSLAYHDIKDSCVMVIHYKSISCKDNDNSVAANWIILKDIKANIEPCSDYFKVTSLNITGYGTIEITNATLVDGGDILIEAADGFEKLAEATEHEIREVFLAETEYGWRLVAWLDIPADTWWCADDAIVAGIEQQEDISILQNLLRNGVVYSRKAGA